MSMKIQGTVKYHGPKALFDLEPMETNKGISNL